MEILIPIVATFFAIISIFFLWFFGYPFLLRFTIDSSIENTIAAGANGANGIDGANGQNSPEPQHGTNGRPGKSSPSGANGNNGINGRAGESGNNGLDGLAGDDGSAGDDGVPGYNIIAIKEKADGASPPVYYINGKSIDDQTEAATKTSEAFLSSEKTRVNTRISSVIPSNNDKLLFSNHASGITTLGSSQKSFSLAAVSPSLDTINDYHNFLTTVKNTREQQRAALAIIKQREQDNIKTQQNLLALHRLGRRESLRDHKLSSNLLTIRRNVLDNEDYSNCTSRFKTIISDLRSSMDVTFDEKIRGLYSMLLGQRRIANSADPSITRDARKEALIEVNQITDEINHLKTIKENIRIAEDIEKKDIHNTYKENTKGLKSSITSSKDAIVNATKTSSDEIEKTILPYRNLILTS